MRSPLPGGACRRPIQRGLIPKSVYDDAHREAEKHKWIESKHAGCDLGQSAIEDWYRKFWKKYCRARRIEHLSGEQQWLEFDEREFGQMYEMIQAGNPQLDDLIHRIEDGWENLQFMLWMHQERKTREEIDGIIDLLEIININIARLDRNQHHAAGESQPSFPTPAADEHGRPT